MKVIGSYSNPLQSIESAGRTCYLSFDKITDGSAEQFIRNKILGNGHDSVIEHSRLVVEIEPEQFEEFSVGIAVTGAELEISYFGWDEQSGKSHKTTGRAVVSGNYRAWRDLIKGLRERSDIMNIFFGRGSGGAKHTELKMASPIAEMLNDHCSIMAMGVMV